MESTYVLQYDVAKDFEPIVLLADAPLLRKRCFQAAALSAAAGA